MPSSRSSTDNNSNTGLIVGIVLGVLVVVIVVVVSICLCACSSAASRDADGDELVCHQPVFNTVDNGPTVPMAHYGAVQNNFEPGAPPADIGGGHQVSQGGFQSHQGGFQQVSQAPCTGHENVIAI